MKHPLYRVPAYQRATVQTVANEYRAAFHNPTAYQRFMQETLEQWSMLAPRFAVRLTSEIPYTDSADMLADVKTGHIAVYTGGSLHPTNPLGTGTRFQGRIEGTHYGRALTVNEVFRAVHDVIGHCGIDPAYQKPRPFHPFETFQGEVSAFNRHASWYSALALPALYSETIGQLCHYYAGYGFVKYQECRIIPVRSL